MPSPSDTTGTLFEQLRPRLTAISRRIVGSQADAEDIVQDCFLKWHGAEQAALATPAAWLTTVVRHQSIDCLRKRARDAAAAQAAIAFMPEATPSPEDALLLCAGVDEALARLLARLSPAERLTLVLHEVFECGHADIAAVLGTRAVNARQYLTRARRRLLAGIDAEPPEEKLCRELVRRFQAALNGLDVAAVVNLLGEMQPVSVRESPRLRTGLRTGLRIRAGVCANDAAYGRPLAA